MENKYITLKGEHLSITEDGLTLLEKLITDTRGNVYAFYPEAPPILVAAAMARLSRSPHDLRKTYLNEFVVSPEKAEELITRVVAQFGDDSVQQLLGMHVVVENASNLLTKKLEWGRFLSYLEQSTRYIFFDQKIDEKYRYYIPEHFQQEIKNVYVCNMNKIFDLYSAMVRELTEHLRKKHADIREKDGDIVWKNTTRAQACDAIRPTLPAATTSTVGIFGSSQGIENLIMHLLSEDVPEFVNSGNHILREVRKVAPSFFKRADIQDRGLVTVEYMRETRHAMREITKKLLPLYHESSKESVVLVDYWPKDELDIVSEMLFEESGFPIEKIRSKVAYFSDEQKRDVFDTYVGNRGNKRHKPGRAFEKIHYEWEITGDYGTFRDLQRHRVVDMWRWQKLTPWYGYDVPQLVIEAGMEEKFRKCFELSGTLYQYLLHNGFDEEAQYATLLGHKMRYQFILNARASFHFIELRSQPAGHPGYRKIVNEMYKKLFAVHPKVGGAIKFVNKGDVHLSRLEAEKATQKKLKK